jgi:hypothetical protein
MGSALISTFACAAPGSAPGVPYLRIVGAPAVTLTAAPPKVGALGKVGAPEGPEIVVFRQVGTAFVVPTDGQLYVPTDGAVTVPYPAVPVAWASAAVLESAMAAASATVASFMAVFFLFVFREKCGESIDRLQRTFSSRLFNLARLAGSFLIVQMPAKANSGRSSLSANHTTSFFLVSGFVFGEAVGRDKAVVLRLEPAAPVRRRRVADVGDRRPACARWRRHAPSHHAQLAPGVGVAHDRSRIIWKHAGHRREVGLRIDGVNLNS